MASAAPQDDEFDNMFSQFASAGEGGEPPVEEPAAEEPEAEPEGEPAAEPETEGEAEPEGEPEGEPEAGTEPEPEGEAEPEGEPEAPDAADVLIDRLTKALDRKQPEAPAAKNEPAPAAKDEPALYTPEEQQILAEYEKEWPDVARAEQLRRRGEYNVIVSHIFEQISARLGPLAETVETLAMRTQLADITERAPDYEQVRDNVISWVDTQPTYLQNAYKKVMQEGTAEEVADLIDRYRQSAGVTKPGTQPAKRPKAEPSETAKKAAKSMAPVSTKRSAVPEGNDPNDFDAAFARFAGQKT